MQLLEESQWFLYTLYHNNAINNNFYLPPCYMLHFQIFGNTGPELTKIFKLSAFFLFFEATGLKSN